MSGTGLAPPYLCGDANKTGSLRASSLSRGFVSFAAAT